MDELRLSPRPNRAGEIAWSTWNKETFRRATEEDKPILLSISAVWCHWCHVMNETSYSGPENLRLINEHFIPIRVDNDRRPDINQRYNMGGWPTTAFLTPEGGLIGGATYLPPEALRSALLKIRDLYRENREDVLEASRKISKRTLLTRTGILPDGKDVPPPAEDLDPAVPRRVLQMLQEEYDPMCGGFGTQPKFPNPEALAFWLRQYSRSRDSDLARMIRKTLDHMATGGIFDRVEGGFFRYSTTRDWSIPHYEKMCEDNAHLLGIYLEAYRLLGEELYRQTAEDILRFVEVNLSDEKTGGFYGSQDADEEYYSLDRQGRAGRPAPAVDPTIYGGWTALMAAAYFKAFAVFGRGKYRRRGLQAMEFLWNDGRIPGRGIARYYSEGEAHFPNFVGDQVETLSALLAAHEASGKRVFVDRARHLAADILARWGDENQKGFYDTAAATGPGFLAERLKPFAENSRTAAVLARYKNDCKTASDVGRRLNGNIGDFTGTK